MGPTPHHRGSAAGWLHRQGQLPPLPQSLQSWPNLAGTRPCSQSGHSNAKKLKSKFRKSWVILTHPESSSWSIGRWSYQSKRQFSAPVKSRGSLLAQEFLCCVQVPDSATNKAPGAQGQNHTSAKKTALRSQPLSVHFKPLVLNPFSSFTIPPSTPNSRVLTIPISK